MAESKTFWETWAMRGRFGTRPPSPAKLLVALTEKTDETLVSHGAATANRLGLTTQMPVREIFLTSGRSRTLRLNSRVTDCAVIPFNISILLRFPWLNIKQSDIPPSRPYLK